MRPDRHVLTPRQVEVVRWLSEGKTRQETAMILGIGYASTRSHINMAMARLDAVNATHLVAKALRSGVLA